MAYPIIRIATQLLRFVLCLELVPPEFNHFVTNYGWKNYRTLQKNISFFLKTIQLGSYLLLDLMSERCRHRLCRGEQTSPNR